MTKSAIPNVIRFPKRSKNISTIGRLMYPVRKTCERDGTRARVRRTMRLPEDCIFPLHNRSMAFPLIDIPARARPHISPLFLVRCLIQSVKTLVNPGGSGDPYTHKPGAAAHLRPLNAKQYYYLQSVLWVIYQATYYRLYFLYFYLIVPMKISLTIYKVSNEKLVHKPCHCDNLKSCNVMGLHYQRLAY